MGEIMDALTQATKIVQKLVREGYVAYFAGGWVRDYLMGHPSYDIDIATNATPDKILDLFPNTILVGLAFGVVIVSVEGHQFEVSSFRKDLVYLDGRKPDKIEFSNAEEDAQRRDFTINGMFYDPLADKVFDYVNGMEDLQKGLVKTIGDAQERFAEDRLRMVRAIRFASRFGFAIDLATQEGIMENASTLFPAVAMERIWQEFNKMAMAPRFDHAIIEMHRLGLLGVIFPILQGVHLNDVKHRVASFGQLAPNTPTIAYLMELFPDASLNELLDICQYLRTSTHDAKLVEFIYDHRDRFQREVDFNKLEWSHFYANPFHQICLDLMAARFTPERRRLFFDEHLQRQESLLPHIERIQLKKPLITGATLQAKGIPPGKLMGTLLKEAENLVVNYDLHDPEEVVALLTQSSNWPKKG